MNNAVFFLPPRIPHRGRFMAVVAKVVIAWGLIAWFPLPSPAGQQGIALKGTLEDSTAAPVPGVDVVLRSLATGKELHSSTDEDGLFDFSALSPGRYVLEVSPQGFEKVLQPVEIGATPPRPLRIRLQLAEIKQQVTVSAQASTLAPSTQENKNDVTLDLPELSSLPVKDADPLAVPSLFLDPASVGARGPQLIVDGVESSSLDVPLSSVKEVALNKNPYSAEFARPGTGRLEITTRKGAHRRYRGQITQLVRNSALDARNPFASTVPELQRGVSEVQLSGPVTQHVTFFVAGQYYTNNEAEVINALTPNGPLVQNFMAPSRKYYAFGRLDYGHRGHQWTLLYKFKDKPKRDQNVGGFNLPETATDAFDRENEFKFFETESTSGTWINNLRVTFKQEPQGTFSDSASPAIVVPGFFAAGGAQVSRRVNETTLLVEDVASWVKSHHTTQFGFAVRPRDFTVYNASNFGGTFNFSSLSAFRAGTPLRFTLNEGVPNTAFSQDEYFSFIQDEIRLRKDLSLSLGVRHEFQSNVDDYHNFAPRIALAYSPDKGRTVIRAGAGMFYDRQPEAVDEQALLYDGTHIRQIVIPNPGYPDPFASASPLTVAPPSVTRVSPGIVTPYVEQANVSVERQLGKGRNFLTVDFTTLRGLHLYRLRNVNAPLPGTGVRPQPDFMNINQFESSGKSRANSLSVTLHTTLRRRFDLMAQYVLSKSMDDTAGMLPSSASSLLFFPVTIDALYPANSYDLSGEWGRSNFDRRHRFNMTGIYRMPFGFKSGIVVSLSSGIPFNITTGIDDNHDNILNDRPLGVGRNTGQGPGYANVDLHLSRSFRLVQITETARMEFGVDAFNVLNHTNFMNYVGTLTSPYFGLANAAHSARELQFSFHFKF